MPHHEQKNCPRCNKVFEFKAGDIANCQCYGININHEERAYIETRFNDCLCAGSLAELQQKQTLFKEKFLL